ncbi:MAG: hypothetical protein ACLPZR_16750 [Solirubrobacteraceae bacterium]
MISRADNPSAATSITPARSSIRRPARTLEHPPPRPPRADDPLQPHPIRRRHHDPIAHHRLDLNRR